ncbi:MAG: HEAT repeat domain-containing protein, partial [Lachnospiraceae bacterium]|nr:HEAT repeat domain-containing protein [Lachnospiraceae bacterium]
MLRDAYNNIVNGIDVKESLLEIKDSLKSAERGSRTKDALLLMIKDDYSVFYELLKNSDPKIRKNTAIVLGVLGNKDSVDKLYAAYKKEDVMYNMASYVEAIRKIDHTKYVEELKARFNELKKTPLTSDNKKHILEEMKQLKSIFGTGKQEFIGYNLVNECILTTNRNYKDITAAALKNIPHKDFTAGVIVKTDKLRQVLPIRTYDEILFIPDKVKTVT